MRGVALAILLFVMIGVVFATPRWGDDFDWLSDTLLNTTSHSISCINDTVLIRTTVGIFGFRQVLSDSFQLLFSMDTPPPKGGYVSYQLGRSDHLLFGLPDFFLRIIPNEQPTVLPFSSTGLNRQPLTEIYGMQNSTGGDSVDNQAGFPNCTPVLAGNALITSTFNYSTGNFTHTGSLIYQSDSAEYYRQVAYDTNATDWLVRGNYAYGSSVTRHTLSIWDLSQNPPILVNRQALQTPGFLKLFHDTLVTVMGNRWECWSLANPTSPVSLGITILPIHLYWVENQGNDTLLLGWGGHGFGTTVNSSYWTTFKLLTLQSGVRSPQFVASLNFPSYLSPNPGEVCRTLYGWLWLAYQHDDFNGYTLKFLGFRSLRDSSGIHLDTLWQNRPSPTLIDPNAARRVGSALTTQHYNNQILLSPTNYSLQPAIINVDTNDGRHEIRPLPSINTDVVSVGRQFIQNDAMLTERIFNDVGYKVLLYNWQFGNWAVDTIRFNIPPNTDEGLLFYYGSRFVMSNDGVAGGGAVQKVYRLTGDSASLEGTLTAAIHSHIKLLRDSSALCVVNNQLYWYRYNGTIWQQQPGFVGRLDSLINFSTATTWDTLFLFGQNLYVLPRQSTPYPVLYLASIARTLPQLAATYLVDIKGSTVILKYLNYLPTSMTSSYFSFVYSILSNQTAVLRGSIFKSTSEPFLIGNNAVLVGLYSTSTYHIPLYDSTGVILNSTLPSTYSLSSPYPNPFNSVVTFIYSLAKSGNTEFAVYDVLGREVFARHFGLIPAGRYTASWSGRSNENLPIGSGVYFLRFSSGDFQAVKKVVLVK